jgi:predicted RNA binding protein YcfA (HicA-like mRNA interferase family)
VPKLQILAITATLCDGDEDFGVGAYAPTCRFATMPPKIRELIAEVERAGFVNRGGKGAHRNYVHPRVSKPVTISGKLGDDAKQYQVRAVRSALAELDE